MTVNVPYVTPNKAAVQQEPVAPGLHARLIDT